MYKIRKSGKPHVVFLTDILCKKYLDGGYEFEQTITTDTGKPNIKNEIIEHAYQEGKMKQIQIDNENIIDFEKYLQVNIKNPYKQKSIKRVTKIDNSQFNKAVMGILEGEKLNKLHKAKWIANELKKVKEKDEKEIGKCCIRLYTMKSFLYKLLNRVMREADYISSNGYLMFVSERDKIYGRTFGPFCLLLYRYLRDNRNNEIRTVCGGAIFEIIVTMKLELSTVEQI
ncbi:unnamed protein product [Didymodactylos carnosus]|uniref:Uncharacterized protein n=1 Tax=Didymodactylos carnosus TaxID=1234261 RepID=A0A815C3Z5_9BILA|nr:unnamed protein product [Didymodactylos carnosus]CAF4078033.1 unnamed protein product [Didymodactylos carnosus]